MENPEGFLANGIVPKLCPSRSNISKQFQTKPKVPKEFSIESNAYNHKILEFSKNWSENPRVGRLCASGEFDRRRRLKFCPSAPMSKLQTVFSGALSLSNQNMV